MWGPDIETAEYIKIPDLLDRRLYRVYARNLRLGVYNAERTEFWGLRTKFGNQYPDPEYHWDHPHHATCKPFELLEDSIPRDVVLAYTVGYICMACGEPCKYVLSTEIDPGKWMHLPLTDCKPRPKMLS